MTENRSLRLSCIILVDNTMFTLILLGNVFPLIAGIKRRLRIVMLRVFSRFRCRLANAKRTVGRYRVPISVQTTRRERSLFTASPSNFPDDKSLWNSSKARPIRRGRWHDGAKGTFRAFSERERTSWRGDSAASALVMTFTVDVCEAYCFHSQQASSQQLAVAPF